MVIFIFVLLFLLFPQFTFAQEIPQNTISVSPSIARIDLHEDPAEISLTYDNTTDKTVELTFSASDFTELEHGYKPSFLEGKDAKNYKYALSEWIEFDKKSLVISPHTNEKVKIFVNKDRLRPGGHYAAIQAQVINKESSGNVEVQGVLSSLLFVRTATGREREEGKIERFSPERNLIDFPQQFILRFHNTGDTDVIPYGLVEIQDIFGRIVAKGIINEGSLIALPESIRRFDIPLREQTTFLFPGIYTARFTGHFGKTNKQMTATTTFFSQGTIPLLPVGLSIVFIGLLVMRRRKKKK